MPLESRHIFAWCIGGLILPLVLMLLFRLNVYDAAVITWFYVYFGLVYIIENLRKEVEEG